MVEIQREATWRARMPTQVRGLVAKYAGIPSVIFLVVLILGALLAQRLTGHTYDAVAPQEALEAPSWSHLMGTDEFGRDLLTRVLYGARLSLLVGLTATAVGAVVGLLLGMSAGYFRGWIDGWSMRLVDVMLAFPGTLLAMTIVAVLGPSIVNLIVAIGIGSVPGFARLVRSVALSIRETDYVLASESIGSAPWSIIREHIFPNARDSFIVYATLNVATAILNAAALGFLGLGAKPPTPEWGLMVADGRDTLNVAWWITAFPGLAILLTILALNALGETLNASLDPRRRLRR